MYAAYFIVSVWPIGFSVSYRYDIIEEHVSRIIITNTSKMRDICGNDHSKMCDMWETLQSKVWHPGFIPHSCNILLRSRFCTDECFESYSLVIHSKNRIFWLQIINIRLVFIFKILVVRFFLGEYSWKLVRSSCFLFRSLYMTKSFENIYFLIYNFSKFMKQCSSKLDFMEISK